MNVTRKAKALERLEERHDRRRYRYLARMFDIYSLREILNAAGKYYRALPSRVSHNLRTNET